jgi:t-SNARE complex subunit (syntaxin)
MQQNTLEQIEEHRLNNIELVLSKHREMGTLISEELEAQVDLIDKAEAGIDRNMARNNEISRTLRQIGKKRGNLIIYSLIAFLSIILIILIVKKGKQ